LISASEIQFFPEYGQNSSLLMWCTPFHIFWPFCCIWICSQGQSFEDLVPQHNPRATTPQFELFHCPESTSTKNQKITQNPQP